MPLTDDGRGQGWQPSEANGRSPAASPPGSDIPEVEFTTIVRRAAQMGIPGWRISVALGRALPSEAAR